MDLYTCLLFERTQDPILITKSIILLPQDSSFLYRAIQFARRYIFHLFNYILCFISDVSRVEESKNRGSSTSRQTVKMSFAKRSYVTQKEARYGKRKGQQTILCALSTFDLTLTVITQAQTCMHIHPHHAEHIYTRAMYNVVLYSHLYIPLSELNYNKITFTSLYKLRFSHLQLFFTDILYSILDTDHKINYQKN